MKLSLTPEQVYWITIFCVAGLVWMNGFACAKLATAIAIRKALRDLDGSDSSLVTDHSSPDRRSL